MTDEHGFSEHDYTQAIKLLIDVTDAGTNICDEADVDSSIGCIELLTDSLNSSSVLRHLVQKAEDLELLDETVIKSYIVRECAASLYHSFKRASESVHSMLFVDLLNHTLEQSKETRSGTTTEVSNELPAKIEKFLSWVIDEMVEEHFDAMDESVHRLFALIEMKLGTAKTEGDKVIREVPLYNKTMMFDASSLSNVSIRKTLEGYCSDVIELAQGMIESEIEDVGSDDDVAFNEDDLSVVDAPLLLDVVCGVVYNEYPRYFMDEGYEDIQSGFFELSEESEELSDHFSEIISDLVNESSDPRSERRRLRAANYDFLEDLEPLFKRVFESATNAVIDTLAIESLQNAKFDPK